MSQRGTIIVAAAVVAFATTGSHGKPAASTHGGGTRAVSAVTGGTKDCTQLERLWESAGGSPGAAYMAAEIATAESSGQEYATLHDSNGTTDIGYWQINTSHGALATYDPLGNAKAAVQISGDGTDWSPWVTYQIGAYAGKC